MGPLIIAHRGDSAYFPENTLLAFEKALAAGAVAVELDVQLTRDRQVVVLHDDRVDRTTNGRGRIGDLTLAEVQTLSGGYPTRFGATFLPEKVPTLGEVLTLVKGRARVMVEIKRDSVTDDAVNGVEARTVAQVRAAGMEQDVALISFDRRALLRCRELAPDILRGHLFHRVRPDDAVAGALAVGTDLVMPEKRALTDALLQACRDAKLRVATWVVDEVDELRALDRFGLYGVASNRPGALLRATAEGRANP